MAVSVPAPLQELQLLGRKIDETRLADRARDQIHERRRDGDRDLAGHPQRLREVDHTVARRVESSGMLFARRTEEDLVRVLFVQQLDPGIEAECGWDDRKGEVSREWCIDLRTDEVRDTEDRETGV